MKRSKLVELPRQRKISVGQAAGIVGGQRQRDFVPADINVRMMPRLFGEFRYGRDELDRRREILELKSVRDGGATLFPIGHSRQRDFDLRGRQFLHPD